MVTFSNKGMAYFCSNDTCKYGGEDIFYGDFSWEDGDTLPTNSYKPSNTSSAILTDRRLITFYVNVRLTLKSSDTFYLV